MQQVPLFSLRLCFGGCLAFVGTCVTLSSASFVTSESSSAIKSGWELRLTEGWAEIESAAQSVPSERMQEIDLVMNRTDSLSLLCTTV